MKKAFKIILFCIATLIIIIVAAFAYLYIPLWKLEQAGRSYVETSLYGVIENWDKENLFKNVSEPSLERDAWKGVDGYYKEWSKLGTLKNFEINDAVAEPSAEGVVNLILDSTFENGNAKIAIGVVNINGVWKYQALYVKSQNN